MKNKNMLNDRQWRNKIKYLLIIGLCLSVLLLSGCGVLLIYIFCERAHYTTCMIEDSETNRLKVVQVVRLIADRYGLEDRSEEYCARNKDPYWKEYTFLAEYYAPGKNKPSDDIKISAYTWVGKVYADLDQKKMYGATKKYTEIQDRFISEFKERFGEEVYIKKGSYCL